MADNYVFKNLIWKFAGLNLILSAIGKWYTFQLLSGTLFNYHIHDFCIFFTSLVENGKEIAILRRKYLAPLVREGKEIAVMRGN